MDLRAFENWTPGSTPCPRCGLLLPAADAGCARCGAAVQAAEPVADGERPSPVSAPVAFTPPPWAETPSYEAPAVQPPLGIVRPAKRRTRPAVVAAVLAVAALGTVVGFVIHGRSESDTVVGEPTSDVRGSTAPPPVISGRLPLSAVPVGSTDLPSGWRRTAPDPDTSDATGDAQLASCLGIRYLPSSDHGPSADTKYELGPYQISSDAERMRSRARVQADLAALRNPRTNTCLNRLLRREVSRGLPSGAHLDSVRFRLDVGVHGEPAGVVGTGNGQVVMTARGRTVIVYLDMAFISSGRVESDIEFFGVGAPVDATLQDSLIAAVARRTAEA